MEAGLCGTPAVVSIVFALPESVEHEKTGLVRALELGRQSRWTGIWADDGDLEEEIDKANATNRQGIMSAVECVFGAPQLIEHWGAKAYARMHVRFEERSRRLAGTAIDS